MLAPLARAAFDVGVGFGFGAVAGVGVRPGFARRIDNAGGSKLLGRRGSGSGAALTLRVTVEEVLAAKRWVSRANR